MRDFAILAIILGSVPFCFFSPYFGVLMWSWVAYFNPHRYAWGIAYNFPVAVVVAIPTLLGTLVARKINRNFMKREMLLMLALWAWFAITYLHALQVPLFGGHVGEAQAQLLQVSKILLMTFVTVLLITSRDKLKYLLLLTAASLGVRAVAGAIFGLSTGGEFRVYGPPNSFIEDNNDLALALNMMLPVMFFLTREFEKRWVGVLLHIMFFCSIIAVILTYSRGGLLGLAIALAVIAVRSKRKLFAAAMLTAAAMTVFTLIPEHWTARMNGFMQGHLDGSAQQRIAAWKFGWNFVKEYPITGGGFEVFADPVVFQSYKVEEIPGGFQSTGPHSIYFQVLGEQGFVGLGLFLGLLGSCFFTLRRLRRQARKDPSAAWMKSYTYMLEASLLAYMVSGAFLGRAYFDLYFQLVASVTVLRILYAREVAAPARAHQVAALEARVSELALP
jgi:probable O-glycosylation ligase (exosortase A-associated)